MIVDFLGNVAHEYGTFRANLQLYRYFHSGLRYANEITDADWINFVNADIINQK